MSLAAPSRSRKDQNNQPEHPSSNLSPNVYGGSGQQAAATATITGKQGGEGNLAMSMLRSPTINENRLQQSSYNMPLSPTPSAIYRASEDENALEPRASYNELQPPLAQPNPSILVGQRRASAMTQMSQQQLDAANAANEIILMNERFSNTRVTQILYGSSITISIAEHPSCYVYSDGFSSKTIKIKQFESAQGSRDLDFFNTVFSVLPSMEHKYQKQLLEQFVFPDSKSTLGTEDLQKRKQKIQSLQQNIDGEFNANTQLFNKLKGTPVLFSTSSFHLVHKASLKYLSIDDDTTENYTFKFVDFPDQNCLFKFLPCLIFQKQRSNTVFNKDSLFLISSKQIHNRKPYVFTDYAGQPDVNKIDVLSDESSFGKIYASLEMQCKWKINIFQEPEAEDQKYSINVGDSIWLNLSEHHYVVSARPATDVDQRIKKSIRAAAMEHNSFTKNKSLMASQVSQTQAGNNNVLTNSMQPPASDQNRLQHQSSLQSRLMKQGTLGKELLPPNFKKSNTLMVEDGNTNMQHSVLNQSKLTRQLSQNSNSRDLDDEDDFDENIDGIISTLENDIFQINDVEFLQMNFDDIDMNRSTTDGSSYQSNFAAAYQEQQNLEANDDDEELLQNQTIKSAQNNESAQKNSHTNTTQGLWKIESEFFLVGGSLEWKQCYRLRHFTTGKYLTLHYSNSEWKLKMTRRPRSESLFQFERIDSGLNNQKQRFISKDSFFRFKSVHADMFIGLDQLALLELNRYQLKLTTEQSEYSVFKMKKANFDDIWETNFLLCCIPILTESIKFLNRLGKKSVVEKFMKNKTQFESIFYKIRLVLSDIDSFICNTLVSNISVTDEYGKPSLARSNILREQHVLGILCVLLFKIFPREESLKNLNIEQIQEKLAQDKKYMFSTSLNTNNLNPSEVGIGQSARKPNMKMIEEIVRRKYGVCFMVYKIFQNSCLDNKANQDYLFKFMAEFQRQVGSQDIVCESLIRFFRQNRMLLQMLSLPISPIPVQAITRKQQQQQYQLQQQQQQVRPPPSDLRLSHVSGGDKVIGNNGEEKTTHLNLVINKLHQYSANRKSDILKLLSNFCKHLDISIFNNQEKIFNHLISNGNSVSTKNLANQPLFSLSLQGGDSLTIIVSNGSEITYTPIADFLQLEYEPIQQEDEDVPDEENQENGSEAPLIDGGGGIAEVARGGTSPFKFVRSKNYAFLMNQLNLYANLCLNRNYNSVNHFQNIFPLKTLIDHVENDLLDFDFKASFLKLIHYIYLDKEPRTISVKPNFIRVIDGDFESLKADKLNSVKDQEVLGNGQLATPPVIEMQTLQNVTARQQLILQPQASKQNRMNQSNQEAVQNLQRLEGKEMETGQSEADYRELQSLKKLKTDLLDFLVGKEVLLLNVNRETQDKIFNVMTLEAVKMLGVMLKFGIFTEDAPSVDPNDRFRKKAAKTFIGSKLTNMLKKKEEPKPKTEIEKLVEICVKILEYDQFYAENLQQLKIIRKYEHIRKQKDSLNLNLKFMSNGMNLLGQGLDGMKDLLDFSLGGGGGKEVKKEEKKKKAQTSLDIGSEIMSDPLFKKVQGLKKVLFKYTNKTYLSKAEMKKDQEEDYETDIKIQICHIFQELLDIQQDFYLDNAIALFKSNFSTLKTKAFKTQLENLLPPDPLEVGAEFTPDQGIQNFTEAVAPKTFDEILQRSFMETLLISFYFSENSVLSNEIMNLIHRTCLQKHEMVKNVNTIELLLTPESKRIYRTLSSLVSRLKNLVQNSQIWLQISGNSDSELKTNQTISILEQISDELNFEDYLNSDVSQQSMKTAQTIFKHIGGDDLILQLIERGIILFHSNKEVFYQNAHSKSNSISHILRTLNSSFSILLLFCRNNPTHQEKLFTSMFRHMVGFKAYNFGQIPLLYEIIQGNIDLCLKLNASDFYGLAEYILHHGRHSRFLHFFDIIIMNLHKKDDRASKAIQSNVMKILFDERISSAMNPFSEFQKQKDGYEDQYKFFNEDPDEKSYKDTLIRLMSKSLNKDTELSIISRMSKTVTVNKLMLELLESQKESIQFERSKDKQHLTSFSYKKQKMILKILLFYFTKSQKDFIEAELRGNQLLLDFVELVTSRLKEETLYPIKFQVSLIDRFIPLINIYSDLFLRDLNVNLSESQDQMAFAKTQFTTFAHEYIRQADVFNKEYEQVFTREARFRSLMKLSIFFGVPIPRTLGGLKNFNEGKPKNNDLSDIGYMDARGNGSDDIESSSSIFSKRPQSMLYEGTQRGGSMAAERIGDDEDAAADEVQLTKKQSKFNSSQSKLPLIGNLSQKQKSEGQPLTSKGQSMIKFGDIDIKQPEVGEKNFLLEDAPNLNKNASKKDEQLTANQLVQDNWEFVKGLLNTDPDIQEFIKYEESNFSENIFAVQNIFFAEVENDNSKDILLNQEDLLTKCLNYIEFWQVNHSEKSDVIFTIKSLSKLLNLDDDEEEKKIERQCMLDRLNATKISLLIISDQSPNCDYDMLYYVIKFVILILDGGNPQIQKTIFDFFLGNTLCEQFFAKINTMINDQILQETSGQQHIFGEKGSKITLKILRLLQLFCEGHNIDLQNYMRSQISNKKSYDFVTLVIKLLATYKIHNDNFDTVVQCFDTLTEFIQGPCKNNQLTILNSKFLDYAVLVLSEDKKILDLDLIEKQKIAEQSEVVSVEKKTFSLFSRKQNETSDHKSAVKAKSVKSGKDSKKSGKDSKKSDNEKQNEEKVYTLHAGKLARLKHKCLITIVSLLERNIRSMEYVTKIMRTIPLSVLTNNLSRIYMLFQKYEKDYVVTLFNRADEDIDMSKPEEYSELIIENGFNLYILVNLFIENKKAGDEEDEEIQEYIDEFAQTEEEEGGLIGLLKNNILMDISKLGTAFLGMGVGALKDMVKKTLSKEDEAEQEEEKKKMDAIEKKEQRKSAIKFFREQVTRIEIVRDGQLQFIYFPILPFCKMMPNELNVDFRENVTRTSTKTKLAALMGNSYYMIRVMKHEERLRLMFEKYKLLGYLATNIKKWEQIAFIVASAINVIVLFSYSQWFLSEDDLADPNKKQQGRLYDPRIFYVESQTNTEQYIITLGIVTLAFYSIVVAVFLMKKAPILIGDLWEKYYELYSLDDPNEGKKKRRKRGEEDAVSLQLVGALTSHAFGIINKLLLFVVNALKSVLIMLQDYEIIYYTFNMAIVIFGLVIHPFLFVGCLSDVLRSKELKNVVSAIWKPKSEIFLLLILFYVLQYYFTLFAYIFFDDHFSDNRCESLWRCFVTVSDLTFKANGGVGASMQEPQSLQYYMDKQGVTNPDEVTFRGTVEQFTGIYFLRFIYDNFTNIFLLFILINILKGIIVDKFRSLKDEAQQKDVDEMYYCFVCGISREVLDKSKEIKGFMFHIKHEHFMWNYIYYRAYLEYKESTEYNGDESYVRDKIDESDLGWFPVKRTWSVQQKDDGETDKLHTEVLDSMREVNEIAKDTHLKYLSTIEQVSSIQTADDGYESSSNGLNK